MSLITTLLGTGTPAIDRGTINANFASLAALLGAGITASASLYFGAIEDGEVMPVQFAVTGATVGMHCIGAWPALPAGLIGFMTVVAPNTVEARILNMSGGPVTPGLTSPPASPPVYDIAVGVILL